MTARKLLLALCCFFCLSELLAQPGATLRQRFQDTLNYMQSHYQCYGLSAAVNYRGAGSWEGVAGESEPGTPLASDMFIGIGSNTKTYVSVMMLKLWEDGRVSLDDTIGRWLQGYANVSGAITIRQILNHSSGIFNFTNHPHLNDSIGANPYRVWTSGEMLHRFVNPPSFVPGTSWEYSNSNYLIAGMIEEAITGRPLHQLLRDSIINPTGLTKTFFPPFENAGLPYAHFWSDFGNGYLEDWHFVTELYSVAGAAGGIVSTAGDNAKFWQALMSGQIIRKSTLNDQMLQTITLSTSAGYGLGIFREKYFGHTVYSHGGTWLGQINSNLTDTVNGISITVLSNQDKLNNPFTEKVVAALYFVALNPPLEVPAAAAFGGLQLYPNPAVGQLHLSGLQGAVKAELHSMDGRLLQTAESRSGECVFKTAEYPSGSYFIRLSDAAGATLTRQVAVRH